MEGSITEIFHIDWRIMIAQLVNFSIVVLVLWFFAFKPLNRQMGERTETIKKGLKEAAEISEQLKETQAKREETLKLARQESQQIVAEARKLAEQEKEKNLAFTKAEVVKVVNEGKKQLAGEKEKMIKEIKAESADLVVLATEKILSRLADKELDKKLIEKTLKEIK
ncbi:MAG: F0F1 ATP synthase subunit B [bacterium]